MVKTMNENKEKEYIILYDECSRCGQYQIMKAKNIVDACKKWYEYNCGKMTGVTLKIWEKFKPEEFEDCIAWVNSLLYPEDRIDHIIHGMYLYANPSKE